MSDDYFDNEEFDSAFLNEIDAIEAAAASRPGRPNAPVQTTRPPAQISTTKTAPAPKLKPVAGDVSLNESYFNSLDMDESELARLDQFVEEAYAGKAQPAPGPSKLTRQTTLDGSILPESQPKTQTARPSKSKFTSTQAVLPAHRPQRTKTWDHTAFSETGWMSTKPKSKGKDGKKGKAKGDEQAKDGDEEDGFNEDVEFEQFPDLPPPEKSEDIVFFLVPNGKFSDVSSLVGYAYLQ